MKDVLRENVLRATGASALFEVAKIQDLWSGYGTLKRYGLQGASVETVVVKHVCPPGAQSSSFSHRRKLKSYQIETAWYQNWSQKCSDRCYVPKCYFLEAGDDEFFMVLEDLDATGYSERRSSASSKEIKLCLKWLAHFHAEFVGERPEGLWQTGTYWHLETRPDELKVLKDRDLKDAARAIDEKLKSSRFQTFVHGDAKLANFCFSSDGRKVAAVDFQYVGGGCGVKDVAYFIGSCLDEESCQRREAELLDYYFDVLSNVLRAKKKDVEVDLLVEDWRALYPVAWADFHRFLKGWSPGRWNANSYSEKTVRRVIDLLA